MYHLSRNLPVWIEEMKDPKFPVQIQVDSLYDAKPGIESGGDRMK